MNNTGPIISSRAFPLFFIMLSFSSCMEKRAGTVNTDVFIDSVLINGLMVENGAFLDQIDFSETTIRLRFSTPVDSEKFNKNKLFFSQGIDTAYKFWFSGDSESIIVKPESLKPLTSYRFTIASGQNAGSNLREGFDFSFITSHDTTSKFVKIPDDSLLSLVQHQTLKYFLDYAHPSSGLARERLGSGDVVTSGGTGFGLMAILVGIERNFITRETGFNHLNKVVDFLRVADRFHGVYPHLLNGSTGKVHPFNLKDNGGDLTETAFLMQGLLAVREYFKNGSENEQALCDSITKLWEEVEWDWFRNDQNMLFSHWSPVYNWDIGTQIAGWNEYLIAYVLAASSPSHSISPEVYDEGWARHGAYPMMNGNLFYNIKLPLGEDYGGPLMYSHYSFSGLDPRKLRDKYASYWEQNVAHSLINLNYCIDNPKSRRGYGETCWGLSASDIPNGFSASSPLNDLGVITPSAALASMPYTPTGSIKALKFYYYVLGDRLWGEYGFRDAFSLTSLWFSDSYLAENQGIIICMIENYRTGFLWNLFMASEEIRSGLKKLGFAF